MSQIVFANVNTLAGQTLTVPAPPPGLSNTFVENITLAAFSATGTGLSYVHISIPFETSSGSSTFIIQSSALSGTAGVGFSQQWAWPQGGIQTRVSNGTMGVGFTATPASAFSALSISIMYRQT